MVLAAVVDWEAIGRVVIASFVAGVGVATAYALGLYGATRFADLRRDGRVVEAVPFAVLATVAFAACVAALVLGIIEMASKD
jgi:hypothetical protein